MVLTGKKSVGGPPKMSYQLVCGGTLFILLPVSTIVLTSNKKGVWSPKMTYQLEENGHKNLDHVLLTFLA